jgi:hypothetical protein
MYDILRLFHIIFSIYVGGMYIFLTWMLVPKLHKLGPDIERKVLRSILSVASPVGAVSAIALFITGVWMTLLIKGGDIGSIFTTAWGIWIFIGFMAALGWAILGFGILMPKGMRLEKLLKASDKGKLSKEASVQVDGTISRLLSIEKINFFLVMVAILSMVIARII